MARILVSESSYQTLLTLYSFFEIDLGHIVLEEYGDPEETILRLQDMLLIQEQPPDLLIKNLGSEPETDGIAVLRWLREHRNETMRIMPVIIIIDVVSFDTIEMLHRAGANALLVKPFTRNVLRSLCEASSAHEQ